MIAPKAAAKLHEAGEGATVTLRLGGEIATEFFAPLEVTGVVRRLRDGPLPLPRFGSGVVNMGKSAIFEVSQVTLLITELRGAGGNLQNSRSTRRQRCRLQSSHEEPPPPSTILTTTAQRWFAPSSKGPGQSDIFTLPWKRTPARSTPLETFTDRNIARKDPIAART